ncbi:hypothetical protein ACMYSQ_008027 [Aspergillus niger]
MQGGAMEATSIHTAVAIVAGRPVAATIQQGLLNTGASSESMQGKDIRNESGTLDCALRLLRQFAASACNHNYDAGLHYIHAMKLLAVVGRVASEDLH